MLGCSDNAGDKVPTESSKPSLDEGHNGNDGSGRQFKLIGNAEITRDPENRTNTVLKVVSDGNTPVGVERDLRRVKIWQLDHQLNFHRAFVAPHSCGGGSPRIILLIDANGDGKFQPAADGGPDFAANGQVRPPFAACETSLPTGSPNGPSVSTLLWRFEDVTDEQTRWEITAGVVPGFPPYPGATWDQLEALVSTAFPDNQVLQGRLIEDFNNTGPGTSYYDLITIFDLTLGTRGQIEPQGRDHNDN